jgi:hypothetical protein
LVNDLNAAFRALGVTRALAPNPVEFNATIIHPIHLVRQLSVGATTMHRNQGVPADGTFLAKPHDAGIFSAGGCGVIVAAYRGDLIFAHAGR